MEYRNIPGTDLNVSRIGLGTWQFSGRMGTVDRTASLALIRRAIDSGINLVDTAEAYAECEEQVGRALDEGYRRRCILMTKASRDFSPTGIRRALEESLRKLRTDSVDIYLLHRYRPEFPLRPALEELDDQRRLGKIRYIGVSNFNVEQCRDARQVLPDIVLNQINYNMLNRRPEKEMLPFASGAGMGIIAHSALAKGLLSGTNSRLNDYQTDDERSRFPGFKGSERQRYHSGLETLLSRIGKFGMGPVATAIQWLLSRKSVTSILSGPKSDNQLEILLQAADLPDGLNRQDFAETTDRCLAELNLPTLCPNADELV